MTALRTLLCMGLFVIGTGCGGMVEPQPEPAPAPTASAPARPTPPEPPANAVAKGDREAQPDLPKWDCSGDGYRCCIAQYCCNYSPYLGWVCQGGE